MRITAGSGIELDCFAVFLPVPDFRWTLADSSSSFLGSRFCGVYHGAPVLGSVRKVKESRKNEGRRILDKAHWRTGVASMFAVQ